MKCNHTITAFQGLTICDNFQIEGGLQKIKTPFYTLAHVLLFIIRQKMQLRLFGE